MSGTKKIFLIAIGALLLFGLVFLLGPWRHSPDEVVPVGSRKIQLPDPKTLGVVLPAEPVFPSGSRVSAHAQMPSASSIPQEPRVRQGVSAVSRQKAPKAFTPPPAAIRQIKKEGSILY